MAFIYKIENLLNGKVYIGKSKYNNPEYMGSGLRISGAIKKYGVENFKKIILEECSDEIVNNREIFWISYYNSTSDTIGYNISKGGEGGDHYWSTLNEDGKRLHRQKLSIGQKKRQRKPHSEETKKKMSENFCRDPEFFKRRALSKCKKYICVNHSTREIFNTSNLNEFCESMQLNKGAMQHNARTKKTMCNVHWSCRILIDYYLIDTVEKIEKEIVEAAILIKKKLSAKNNKGEHNPMFGRKHTDVTKEKMRQIRLSRKK